MRAKLTPEQRLLARERDARWRANNPEKAREVDKAKAARWRERHPDKSKEVLARYREGNRAVLSERQGDRYRDLVAADPEHFRRYYRADYANNPIKYRHRDWRNKYGLSPDQWEGLFNSQGRVCAACKGSEPGAKDRHWHVDHCHKTDVVRGILCHHCNTALGLLKDDPDRIKALFDYLTPSSYPER